MSASRDAVKFWLDAAGRYPVLHPNQVIRLAQQVQGNPPESKAHKKAVEKLVRHNLKLIPRIARRAIRNKQGRNSSLNQLEDALQAGVLGLTRAAQLYDPKRGYAFSTYANAWIFQAVKRDLYNNISPIRVPENTIREYYSVFKNCKTKEDLEDIDQAKLARYRAAGVAMNCLSMDSGFRRSSHSDEAVDMQSIVAAPDSEEVSNSVVELVSLSDTCNTSKAMVVSYYEEELSIQQVASRFEVSEEVASRMIRKCISSIKDNLVMI